MRVLLAGLQQLAQRTLNALWLRKICVGFVNQESRGTCTLSDADLIRETDPESVKHNRYNRKLVFLTSCWTFCMAVCGLNIKCGGIILKYKLMEYQGERQFYRRNLNLILLVSNELSLSVSKRNTFVYDNTRRKTMCKMFNWTTG